MIETETYDIVHGRITAKTLMGLGDNPLSLAIKVSPFKIFSFWKCVYSYKLLDLHFTFLLLVEKCMYNGIIIMMMTMMVVVTVMMTMMLMMMNDLLEIPTKAEN